jgi:hypothetical protein
MFLLFSMFQSFVFSCLLFVVDNPYVLVSWPIVSILLLLYLEPHMGLFFLLAISGMSVIVFQTLDFFALPVFSSMSTTAIWTISSFLVAVFYPLNRNPPSKNVGLAIAVFAVFPIFLFTRNSDVRIAAFLTGWDHTGAHASITKSLLVNDTYHYFPVDYVGSSPKLLHGLLNMFLFSGDSPLDFVNFVQFFDFFSIIVIAAAIISIKPFKSDSRNSFAATFSVLALSFVPIQLPWAIQMGFSTLIFAIALLLAGIKCLEYRNPVFLVLTCILLIISISHTWTPLILVSIMASITSLKRNQLLTFRNCVALLFIMVFGSLPILSVLFSKGLGTTFQVGDVESSPYLLLNALGIAAILFLSRSRLRNADPLWFGILGGFISVLIIKLYVVIDPITFPYYSIKIMWAVNILIIPIIVDFLLATSAKTQVLISFLSILVASYTFHFGQMPYNAGSPYKVLYNPPQELVWQSRASLAALNSGHQKAIVYSANPYDSRGAQLLSHTGILTWNAFDGLESNPESICQYLVLEPSTIIFRRPGTSINCKPENQTIIP